MILAVGAGLALAAGLAVAALIATRHRDSDAAPPASQGGLVIQTGRDDDIRLDPRRPLRCFVNGQLVGELPLVDCARRNGVATGGLDVGLDPSGALAASHGMSADITPLPPPAAISASAGPPIQLSPSDAQALLAASPEPAPAAAASCLRYGGAGWRRLPYDMSLNACVQALYEGQCIAPGAALYGRWGDRTLRLVPGRVEISADNRNFRPLVRQGPACSLPPVAAPRAF